MASKNNSKILHEIRVTKSKKLLNKRLNGDKYGRGKLPEKWKFLIDAPFKISHKCCDKLKKEPIKKYEKKTGRKGVLGILAQESFQRRITWYKNGCNSFTSSRPISNPLSFWLFKDIWKYIKVKNLPYCNIYDKGLLSTGCIFCMFGMHKEKAGLFYKNKFQLLRELHPKKYEYCMNTLGLKKVLLYSKIYYF